MTLNIAEPAHIASVADQGAREDRPHPEQVSEGRARGPHRTADPPVRLLQLGIETTNIVEQFDRELRSALAGSVWHTGCTNWYVDEHGNDPNQWPWVWSAYRRRASRIDPAAYELTAP